MLLMKLVAVYQKKTIYEMKKELNIPKGKAIKDDVKLGRALIKAYAFEIPGFKELYENKKYVEALRVFLEFAGTRAEKPEDSLFDHYFPKAVYTAKRTPYWNGLYSKAIMDTFPELKFNVFDFGRLPKYYNARFFDKDFVLRQAKYHEKGYGHTRSGKWFILDQAKEYFKLNSDLEAMRYLRRKFVQGMRIFTQSDIDKELKMSERSW